MFTLDTNIQDLQKKETVEEKQIINPINYNLIFSKAGFLAGIIKIPPKEEKKITFNELPRTQEDEKKIEDLITSMGIYGKVDLLFNHEKRLKKIGNELRYLHPFKFLGYIFSNHNLKTHMATIFDDYFKRTNFVKDFAQTMDIYDLKNKLTMYLEDFSREVNINPNAILPFIDEKDWEGLIRFLIKN